MVDDLTTADLYPLAGTTMKAGGSASFSLYDTLCPVSFLRV